MMDDPVVDPNIVHPSNEHFVHEEQQPINEEPDIVNLSPCLDEVHVSEEETFLNLIFSFSITS